MIKYLLEDAEKFCNSNPNVMTAFKTGLRSGYIEGRNKENHRIIEKACNSFCKVNYGDNKGCCCKNLRKFRTLLTEGEE